jgi:hypothetical protein
LAAVAEICVGAEGVGPEGTRPCFPHRPTSVSGQLRAERREKKKKKKKAPHPRCCVR